MTELERKWRLFSVPDLDRYIVFDISQGYLIQDDDFEEMVIKSVFDKAVNGLMETAKNDVFCTITSTLGNGPERESWGKAIPIWLYDKLQEKANGFIYKTMLEFRDYSSDDNLCYQIDIYKGYLKGLIVLEIEFSSIEAANDFVLPEWVGKAIDVTGDSRYNNANLSRITGLEWLD